jgi:hypothetical protein
MARLPNRVGGEDGRDQTANSPRSHVEPISDDGARKEFFDAETGAQNPPFRPLETIQRPAAIRKAPVLAGLARRNWTEFDSYDWVVLFPSRTHFCRNSLCLLRCPHPVEAAVSRSRHASSISFR